MTLEARTIEECAPEPASFDYVIAHGVYSWVAPAVRDRLLAVCRSALADHGVAYVSYNALPGGRLREALRDMLVFHTAGLTEPRERIAQARALLRFLVEGSPSGHELGALMRDQAERLLDRADASLLHDELAEVNEAVYFHEFAAHAARHELQYLAEADFFEMQIGAASEPGRRRPARGRGPGAPRAVPGLPQGPDVPPDAAVPRRAGDRPHAAPRGPRAPRVLHPGAGPRRARPGRA